MLCLFSCPSGPPELCSQTSSPDPAKWLYLGTQWLSRSSMILSTSMSQHLGESARSAAETTIRSHRLHCHFLAYNHTSPSLIYIEHSALQLSETESLTCGILDCHSIIANHNLDNAKSPTSSLFGPTISTLFTTDVFL